MIQFINNKLYAEIKDQKEIIKLKEARIVHLEAEAQCKDSLIAQLEAQKLNGGKGE